MTQLILAVAHKIGISGALLLSVCTIENNLKTTNTYNDGGGYTSFSVCQVQLRAAKDFGSHYDSLALQQPKVNIKIAAKYLKKQLQRYKGDVRLAVAAYNSGTVKFNRKGQLINRAYVNRVLSLYERIKK